jgi:DNA-binding transcriptional ArsR family regulator
MPPLKKRGQPEVKQTSLINTRATKKVITLYRTLVNARATKIIDQLKGGNRVTVTELSASTGMVQSNVSALIAQLKAGSIVNEEREGRFTYYTLNMERVAMLNQSIQAVLAA